MYYKYTDVVFPIPSTRNFISIITFKMIKVHNNSKHTDSRFKLLFRLHGRLLDSQMGKKGKTSA